MSDAKPYLDKLERLIRRFEKEAKELLYELERATRTDYSKIPGTIGTFDGTHLITQTGEKYEVPANYAAKSKLVYGDTLKLIEENGKKLFKQIEKVERKLLDGILTRKDGKWYVLTSSGSYKISDIAADFNGAQLNLEARVLIPEKNPEVMFAALDEVIGGVKKPEVSNIKTEQTVVAKDKLTQAQKIEPVKTRRVDNRSRSKPSNIRPNEGFKPKAVLQVPTTPTTSVSVLPKQDSTTTIKPVDDEDLR